MPEYPSGSGSIYPDNTTAGSYIEMKITAPTGTGEGSAGVYCSLCGHKMYHSEKSNMWRCPQCMD